MEQTTRKKFLAVFIAAVLLGAVLIFVLKIKTASKELSYEKQNQTEENKRRKEYLLKDEDGDGLKDWEEILWKTDPLNPDTDHDGTPDGEEIRANRDPLKKPPDELTDYSGANASSTAPETLTQKLGKNFLFNYLSVKGLEGLTEEQKKNIEDSVFSEILSGVSYEKKYSEGDIKTINDNSKESVKNYINNLGKIFKNFEAAQKNDLEIFEEIVSNEKENKEKLKELENNKIIYKKTAYEILNLAAPSGYKNIHLGFSNVMNNTASAMDKMGFIYSDPAKALAGVKEYVNESENIMAVFREFKNKFNSQKIEISPSESGYIFIKNYFPRVR